MVSPNVNETHRLSPYAATLPPKVSMPDLVALSLQAVPPKPNPKL